MLLLFPILLLEHFEILSEIKCLFDNSWGFLILTVIALFIPAAVKRWNWRHVLVMSVLAVASTVIGQVLFRITVEAHRMVLVVLVAATPLLILGLGEMFLQRKRSWGNLACLAAAALTVSAAYFVVSDYLWATGWMVSLPNRYGHTGRQSLVGVIQLPLLAVLTWLAIPACLRISKSGSLKRRMALGGTFAGAIVVFIIFRQFVFHPLLEISLAGAGPFERAAAVSFLSRRGRNSDFKRIWRALAEADWAKPPMWESDKLSYIGDWRQMVIAYLARRDSADTAERLSRLLCNKPHRNLANDAARLLAKHKRYETVPILMRYALGKYPGDCIKALEQMNLPRAAFPIMRREIVWKIRIDGIQPTELSKETCERLKPLLGDNAGTKIDAWLLLYDKVIAKRPTPLPEPIRLETDRVIHTMVRYYALADEWAQTSLDLGRQKGWSLEQVRKMSPSIPKPNWDVITTEELEREIKAYGERVKTAIDKHSENIVEPTPAVY